MAKRRPSGDGMVRKREDGRWEGRIVVGHKENGEPIFRYVLAKTQKELLAKLHRDMDIYQDAQLTEDSRMTLGEWLDRWMEEYGAVTLRPNTLRSYEQYIRCYVKPYLGGKIVSRVTRLDIQKLYRNLKKEGRVHDHPEYGHKLSDSMVLRIHAMLHRCLKDAEAAHVIARNPTDGAAVPKANHRPKQILTKEQMDIFLAAVDRNEIWRDFFYTELTTGLRRGELLALQWDDLDLGTGELRISRQVSRVRGKLTVSQPKTDAAVRTIVLSPAVTEQMRRYREQVNSRWIFPSPKKEDAPRDPAAVRKLLSRVLKRAQCPKVRFHDLRHTFVTTALEYGMDVKTLSAVVGHRSSSTTLNVYTHVTKAMERQAAAKIDQGIGKQEVPTEEALETKQPTMTTFRADPGKRRKPGTGCVHQIGEHLWEGRYSPRGPDGKQRSRNVYGHTPEECEEKLNVLIETMKAEIQAERRQLREAGNRS